MNSALNRFFAYLSSRFREPSSQAGMSSVAGAIHLLSIHEYTIGIPMLLAGISATLVSDKVPTIPDVREATRREAVKTVSLLDKIP